MFYSLTARPHVADNLLSFLILLFIVKFRISIQTAFQIKLLPYFPPEIKGKKSILETAGISNCPKFYFRKKNSTESEHCCVHWPILVCYFLTVLFKLCSLQHPQCDYYSSSLSQDKLQFFIVIPRILTLILCRLF